MNTGTHVMIKTFFLFAWLAFLYDLNVKKSSMCISLKIGNSIICWMQSQ